MTKKAEFKEALKDILNQSVGNLSWEEKVVLVQRTIIEVEKTRKYDQSNSGKSWTDDELRLVLSMAPTPENVMLLAKAFKRGLGSIEQIYRWAGQSDATIDKKRPDDAFIQQIKRIRNEKKWHSVGMNITNSTDTI